MNNNKEFVSGILGFLSGFLIALLVVGSTGLTPRKGKGRLRSQFNTEICVHYLDYHATNELDSLRFITTMPNCSPSELGMTK